MAADPPANPDAHFQGRIPELYQQLLVPMIFQAAADSLAGVVASFSPREILETAAGTGALTRALVRSCPEATITASDLNQPMLDAAAGGDPLPAVTWHQADALNLPWADHSFDVVACQFGVMFFPDRVTGFREAGRVLKPGGAFVFSTWDKIEKNIVTCVIQEALVASAPDHPLDFMSRTPHGYYSSTQILADVDDAGMTGATIKAVDGTSRTTATDAAVAFCQGTPLRIAIENHPTLSVEEATAVAEEALLRHFGAGPIDAPIRWFEVIAQAAVD